MADATTRAPRQFGDAIGLVEAAYDIETREHEWMESVARRAKSLIPGALDIMCFRMDASDLNAPIFGPSMVPAIGYEHALLQALTRVRPGAVRTLATLRHKASTASESLGLRSGIGRFILSTGAKDAFGCFAIDAERRGYVISTGLSKETKLPPRSRWRWLLLAVHVAAAARLRLHWKALPANDENILSPSGRLLHAASAATGTLARERLRDAVLARDRARTRRVRSDPDAALGLWPGLVSGRWSLIDRFERDGRRYVVARLNDTDPTAARA